MEGRSPKIFDSDNRTVLIKQYASNRKCKLSKVRERKTGTGGFTDRGEMKRLPEFRERGNLGAGTMLCRPENQGEKNRLVLKLKKKTLLPICQIDKVASAQISVNQPPTLCLVSNH